MTRKRTGGRVKYRGVCGLCGSSSTGRWYHKIIPNKTICKSCYQKHRLENDPNFKPSRNANNKAWSRGFKGAVKAAKARNLEFTLTKEQWENKTKNCQYCWADLTTKTGTKLDRIDSNLSYTDENTVGCCKTCNVAKNNMTMEEFKLWLSSLCDRFLRNCF
jgi:hypothetical protein